MSTWDLTLSSGFNDGNEHLPLIYPGLPCDSGAWNVSNHLQTSEVTKKDSPVLIVPHLNDMMMIWFTPLHQSPAVFTMAWFLLSVWHKKRYDRTSSHSQCVYVCACTGDIFCFEVYKEVSDCVSDREWAVEAMVLLIVISVCSVLRVSFSITGCKEGWGHRVQRTVQFLCDAVLDALKARVQSCPLRALTLTDVDFVTISAWEALHAAPKSQGVPDYSLNVSYYPSTRLLNWLPLDLVSCLPGAPRQINP